MNWQLERFHGKDVVFVGAGKGRALAGVQTFLEQHGQLASFTGVDKQPGTAPLAFLRDYDAGRTIFIKNEGIPAVELPVSYITPMQLFFELVGQTNASTIGITGTKGKSTTTALTAHMLQTGGKSAVLAGNIGVSPLPALDTATAETVFVLELSSYQLADLRVSPHISACINLYNDHADWHGSQANYWEAKHNIMRYAGANDTFVYNPRFATLAEWARAAVCRTIAINPDETLDMSRTALYGDHNQQNALIARAIARLHGVSDADAQSALDSFQPLRHRMQMVAVMNKRTYIDDAIGMTPESTLASLQAITSRHGAVGCLLLGGQDRGYDFTELIAAIAARNIPNIVLFPDTANTLRANLPAEYRPRILETRDMAEAVRFASTNAPAGSVVLLSTAAPSYSVWKDFEDKGDQFQQAVAALTSA